MVNLNFQWFLKDAFEFHSIVDGGYCTLDTHPPGTPEKTPRDLGSIMRGFVNNLWDCMVDIYKQTCNDAISWLVPSLKCDPSFFECVRRSWSGTQDVWDKSTITVYKKSKSELLYRPECYSFQFPEMEFSPEVNISVMPLYECYINIEHPIVLNIKKWL